MLTRQATASSPPASPSPSIAPILTSGWFGPTAVFISKPITSSLFTMSSSLWIGGVTSLTRGLIRDGGSYFLFLLDWLVTEPANVLVKSLDLGFWSAFPAACSTSAPVCFLVPDCASADAARVRCIPDELLEERALAACEATEGVVCLVLLMR